LKIGKVTEIQSNQKILAEADRMSGRVAIKIQNEAGIGFGRQFDKDDKLVSIVKTYN